MSFSLSWFIVSLIFLSLAPFASRLSPLFSFSFPLLSSFSPPSLLSPLLDIISILILIMVITATTIIITITFAVTYTIIIREY